jgi:hypothetical protein
MGIVQHDKGDDDIKRNRGHRQIRLCQITATRAAVYSTNSRALSCAVTPPDIAGPWLRADCGAW